MQDLLGIEGLGSPQGLSFYGLMMDKVDHFELALFTLTHSMG